MPWRPASGAVSVSQTWFGWSIYSIYILSSSCAPGRRRETPHPFFKHAERVDVALDFGWRSAGAPGRARFWRDGVERFTAVTGLSSMPALASECDCDAEGAFSAACIIATDHATNPRQAAPAPNRVRSDPAIRFAGDDGAPGHRSRPLVASAHRAVDRGIRPCPPLRPFFLHSCRARLGVA